MSKIFLGTTDICGQLSDFSKDYKLLGHKAFTYVYSDLNNYNKKYDFVLSKIYPSFLNHTYLILLRKTYTLLVAIPIDYAVLIWAAIYFDVFHFMWFKHRNMKLYLMFLRLLKREVIVSFVGSDVRWIPVWVQELDSRNLSHISIQELVKNGEKSQITLNKQLHYIRLFERYSSIILSIPEQAQLQLKPYFNFYLPVDLKSIVFKIPENSKPIVAIGISSPDIKNSQSMIETIAQYHKSNAYFFEYVVIENLPHKEVLNILSNSDIFLYTPYMPGSGKFGMEAMAAGALLMTGYDSEWIQYPPNPPLIEITPSDMLEKLEYYLRNKEERIDIVKKARAYALEYANSTIIAKNILCNLYNSTSIPEYVPDFFREKATFETDYDSSDSIEICNKWTKFVSNCPWYKENVNSGTRDGLIF